MQALMRDGIRAFWDDPEAKLAFMRPLSSLSHYVDHLVCGSSGWFMRLHSLAWSALLLFSVRALYRKLLGPSLLATLAIFLYAVDDGRGWLVSWVAARNAVAATALSVLALLYYVLAREQRQLGYQLAAPLMLALALLAGEGA